jgi:hypothetical protein
VRVHGRFHRVDDPRRHPTRALATLTAPVGTIADDVRLLALVVDLLRADPRSLLRRPDTTTLEALRRRGFSEKMIERLWRPLFAGIQLDPDLEVSSRRFEVILAMLAEGAAAHPATGVQAIPRQIADDLPPGVVELGARVERIDATTAHLADGRAVRGRALVVATEGPAAAGLLGIPDPGSRSETCVYYAADEAPMAERMIVLDGTREGPVNNLSVVSNVVPTYAPPGRALIAAVAPGVVPDDPDALEADARRQLRGWFGGAVDGWEHLRTYCIPHVRVRRPPRHRVDPGCALLGPAHGLRGVGRSGPGPRLSERAGGPPGHPDPVARRSIAGGIGRSRPSRRPATTVAATSATSAVATNAVRRPGAAAPVSAAIVVTLTRAWTATAGSSAPVRSTA